MDRDTSLDELKQYSIPTSEYYWISGPEIAISKSFIKWYTLFTVPFTAVSTAVLCLTDWWQQLAFMFFFGRLWIYGWAASGITGLALYIQYRRVKKRNAEKRVRMARQQKADLLLKDL